MARATGGWAARRTGGRVPAGASGLPGGGAQGYTPCSGGTIYGPRLSGKVVPDSGAAAPSTALAPACQAAV